MRAVKAAVAAAAAMQQGDMIDLLSSPDPGATASEESALRHQRVGVAGPIDTDITGCERFGRASRRAGIGGGSEGRGRHVEELRPAVESENLPNVGDYYGTPARQEV